MIEALIAGERDPHLLAGLARGVPRHKHEDLVAACDGRFTATHAAMCRLHLDAYDHTTGKIAELDGLVAEAAAAFEPVITRLMTISGIGRRTAEVIVAETGADMSRFPTPEQLTAWAGLVPGNRESAGKRRRAVTRKGNKHLKAAMVEAAWGASRTRSRIGARLRRLVRRFGRQHAKKAAVATAHTLLRVCWAVMARGEDYREDGGDFYDRREARQTHYLAARYQKDPGTPRLPGHPDRTRPRPGTSSRPPINQRNRQPEIPQASGRSHHHDRAHRSRLPIYCSLPRDGQDPSFVTARIRCPPEADKAAALDALITDHSVTLARSLQRQDRLTVR
ncbi:transposase [Nonomuraea dietziae]|uniref:transposase n=1 Tax=Nonomuraea dietziae TaxID=65515 RepID=UPI0031D742C3